MRKFCLIVFLLWFTVSDSWAASATDDFERADSSDLGSAWDSYQSSPCSISGGAVWYTTADVRCYEGYNGLVPGDPQYGQITIQIGGTVENLGLLVRMSAPTTMDAYMCRINSVGSQIEVRANGAQTAVLASESSTAWVDNDTMRCEANGNTITMYRNGSQLIQGTDESNTYPSGRVGIFVVNNGAQIQDFEVGDLTIASPVARRRSGGLL